MPSGRYLSVDRNSSFKPPEGSAIDGEEWFPTCLVDDEATHEVDLSWSLGSDMSAMRQQRQCPSTTTTHHHKHQLITTTHTTTTPNFSPPPTSNTKQTNKQCHLKKDMDFLESGVRGFKTVAAPWMTFTVSSADVKTSDHVPDADVSLRLEHNLGGGGGGGGGHTRLYLHNTEERKPQRVDKPQVWSRWRIMMRLRIGRFKHKNDSKVVQTFVPHSSATIFSPITTTAIHHPRSRLPPFYHL